MVQLESINFSAIVAELIATRPRSQIVEYDSHQYRVTRLPQFYGDENSRMNYKVEMMHPSPLSWRAIACLKIDLDSRPIQRSLYAYEVLNYIHSEHFRIPHMCDSSLHKPQYDTCYWIAIEWIGGYSHPQADQKVLSETALALAEFQVKQPSLAQIASIFKVQLPSTEQIKPLLVKKFTDDLFRRRTESKTALYNEVSHDELDFIVSSTQKILQILPVCDLSELCMNHGDFHLNNVLVPNSLDTHSSLVIIDWENAYLDTFLADVAHFTGFISESEATYFIQAYIKALENFGKQIVPKSIKTTCLVLAAFYLLRHLNYLKIPNEQRNKFWLHRLQEIMAQID